MMGGPVVTDTLFEHVGFTCCVPEVTATAADFVPPDVYALVTLEVFPESASLPLQEYVYAPVPPETLDVQVTF